VTFSVRLRKQVVATISICIPYDEYTVGTQERRIIAVLRKFGGTMVASGVALDGVNAGTRDVDGEVPHGRQDVCWSALREAGFEAEVTDDVIVEEKDGVINIRRRTPDR
jgi:hypothetical protein